MKKRKILFGIIAAILMFGTVSAKGENPFGSGKTSEDLQFLGPDNLAGRSRVVLIDKTAEDGSVLYTGGVAGGLFKSENGGKTWFPIPCVIDGKEENLPISSMVQLADGTIMIGTGEGLAIAELESRGYMVPKGKGLYSYNPANGAFIKYPYEVADQNWNYINDMIVANSYLYVATNGGLFRSNGTTTEDLFNEGAVQDIDLAGDTVYFTSVDKVRKIAVSGASSADVIVVPTENIENAGRIELAVAPSNNNYIYISVADSVGLLEGVYLADTVDHTTWTKISTSSVTLFASYNGLFANTIVVSPSNHKKILVGGTDVWSAEAMEGTSLYSWSTESMSAVGRPSAYYVHENIHDIVFLNDSVYYLATDGGIFKYGTIYDGITIIGQGTIGFSELNRGLTTTQFTSVAVANDGSVFGGTLGHAVSYIKSRNDSDITIPTDDPVNHSAETMWMGNGGWVATSMVHQTAPAEKSVVFVGSEGSVFGRATSDYLNYTNTQTWTTGANFFNSLNRGYYNQPMILWEKFDDTKVIDSLTFTLRAPFVITRKIDGKDSNIVVTDTTKILAGDVTKVRCQANTDYPLNYTFTENFTMTKAGVTYTIKNPYQSRLFLAGTNNGGNHQVYMSPTATDFRKVDTDMKWYKVMDLKKTSMARVLAISEDGDCLFIGAESADSGSYLIRVRKIATVNPETVGVFESDGETIVDTIITEARVITSIAVDPNGDNIVVTCKGEQNGGHNMYYVANATSDNPTVTPKDIEGTTTSIYSSLIVKDAGIIYLGTEKGLYTMANASETPVAYEGMNGVVVSFMTQQIDSLPFVKATYYTGTTPEEYRFGRTKDYRAIYLATYGRGVYVDKSFVNDTLNEVGITEVEPENIGEVRIYPNPAASYTNIELQVSNTTDATIRVFDMSGKVVYTKSLESLTAGIHTEAINCQGLQKGVYLINVVTDSQMMTSKLVVK